MSVSLRHPSRVRFLSDYSLALSVLLLCAVPLAAQSAALWRGAIPWFMDTQAYFYPLKMHAAQLLARGEMPFWNRTLFAGAPFLANPQNGLLYPGHWPMFLFPGPRLFTLINIAHIALFGIGVFFYVRMMLGKRLAGALLAGLLAEVGGWTWAHLAFGSYLQTAAWMPWLLVAFEKCAGSREHAASRNEGETRREAGPLFWIVIAGGMAAMQMLAGAPQLALYCQAGLAGYAVVSWSVRRPRKLLETAASSENTASARPAPSIRFVQAAAFLSGTGLLAAGFSAPQWIPALAFRKICERVGRLELDRVRQGALDARGFVAAWIGGSGTPEDAETILYPGILATLCACLAIAAFFLAKQKRGTHADAFAPPDRKNSGMVPHPLPALCVIALSCAATWKALIPFWYNTLPLFSHFHDPRRVLFLAFFFAVILAGFGFQALWSGFSPRRRPFLIIAAGAVLIEPLLFAQFRIDAKMIPASAFQMLESADDGLRYAPQHPKSGALFSIQPGERFFAQDIGIQYTYNYTRTRFGETLLPNLGALYGLEDIQGYDPFIPWRYALYMRRLNAFPTPAVTLYPSHFGLVRRLDSPWLARFGVLKARGPADCLWPFFEPRTLPPGARFSIPLREQWIMKDAEELSRRLRVYLAFQEEAPAPRLTFHLLAADNQPVGFPLEIIPAKPERDTAPDQDALWPYVLPDKTHPLVRRARVMATEARDDEWTGEKILLENHGPGPVFLYSIGLPRQDAPFEAAEDPETFVSTWQPGFPDTVEVHRAPESRAYYERWAMRRTPDRVVIEIPREVETPPPHGLPVLQDWKWAEKRANFLRIEMPETHQGGWALLSEPFAPGWICRIDGVPARIFPADTLFRAVQVPQGARVLTMHYRPPGFANGLLTACGTAAGVLLLFLRRRRKGE